MPCAAFEDLLERYDDLGDTDRHRADLHLAACPDCREYLETLAMLDRELTGLYREIQPPPVFALRKPVQQSTVLQFRPPNAWPEVLDFCGWAAVVAIVSLLAMTAAARAGITL
jgi:anti-sigma factor RsiW